METDDVLVTDIQKSFFNLLNEHLPEDFLSKLKEKKQIKILSIGCGRFREAKSIFDFFKPFKDKLKLYGIDTSSELIELAKKDDLILKVADASLKESFDNWVKDGLFDLIIIRHPEITFNTDVFIKIFTISSGLLEKNGLIFITTHFENEKESIKLLLKLLKYNLLLEVENKKSPSLKRGKEILFVDRFLLISSVQ